MASIPNVTTNATGTGLGNVTGNVTGNIVVGFPEVQWQGWTTLSLVGCMLVALVAELAPPYMVMMGTLIIFLPLGILTVEDAFHGFADEAMLAVGVLFIVAKGDFRHHLFVICMLYDGDLLIERMDNCKCSENKSVCVIGCVVCI